MNDAQINENVNNKEPYTHIRYIVDKEPITFVELLVQWLARVFVFKKVGVLCKTLGYFISVIMGRDCQNYIDKISIQSENIHTCIYRNCNMFSANLYLAKNEYTV